MGPADRPEEQKRALRVQEVSARAGDATPHFLWAVFSEDHHCKRWGAGEAGSSKEIRQQFEDSEVTLILFKRGQ